MATSSIQLRKYRTLALIVLIQLIFASGYACKVPLWMPSDERAHMLYVQDLLDTGTLHKYSSLDSHYEAIQPPFYYVCSSAICAAFARERAMEYKGYVLRFFGAGLFAATVVILWSAFEALEILSIGTFALAAYAFNPVMLAIFCTVTNDGLFFCLCAAAFLAAIKFSSKSPTLPGSASVGCLFGLATITKLSALPVVFFWLVYIASHQLKRGLKTTVVHIVSICTVSALFVLPWLAWNFSCYHSLTAYGTDAKVLIHGPLSFKDAHQLVTTFASFAAYHFVPVEFWLNQFKGGLTLKLLALVGFSLMLIGTAFLLRKDNPPNSRIAVSSYFVSMSAWLLLISTSSVEPVRAFLAGYFGFCYLMILGFKNLISGTRVDERPWARSILALVPLAFALINILLLLKVVPFLTDYGLKPE